MPLKHFYLSRSMMQSIFLAFLFVLPIYCVWFFEFVLQIDIPLILNSILGLLSVYIFLSTSSRFGFGFWVGLFWFYWVGFSFVYFGFAYLVPIISLVVACIYMLIFAIALWFPSMLYRAITLLLLSFIHPFGFDWLQIDSFFAYSYFGVSKLDFALLIFSVILFKQHNKLFKFSSLAPLLLTLQWNALLPQNHTLPFKIDLLQTQYSQDFKWQQENVKNNTQTQIQLIKQSIQAGNELIVLPETAFPFVLDKTLYYPLLKELSSKATLVLGSMREADSKLYNSTYVFQKGEVKIFDKVILAPFGEKIPLPDFLARPLTRFFLGDNVLSFSASQTFGTFTQNHQTFKSVICYEGTSPEAYKDFTPYLIVISNNAWFPYTIEPAVQKNLMKYYAKLHQTTILHSSNGSPSFVLFP